MIAKRGSLFEFIDKMRNSTVHWALIYIIHYIMNCCSIYWLPGIEIISIVLYSHCDDADAAVKTDETRQKVAKHKWKFVATHALVIVCFWAQLKETWCTFLTRVRMATSCCEFLILGPAHFTLGIRFLALPLDRMLSLLNTIFAWTYCREK